MEDMNKATLHPKTGNIVTPRGRMVWPSLFTPSGMKGDPNAKKKFQVTLLIPKTADISVIKKQCELAAIEKFGANSKAKLRSPFRDTSDNPKLEEWAEEFPTYITARSDDRPGLVGPNGKRVDDEEQVYGGRWGRATIQAYGYDTAGNKGVSFGLQNVQLLDNDDPIGSGRVAPETEFEGSDVEDGEDASSMFN